MKANLMQKVINILLTIVLTSTLGRIQSGTHIETWYDLSMTKVVQQAQQIGIPCEYWVRDDGVKMFGPWVIVAADLSVTRYTRIQTSLGEGIVLDNHTTGDPNLYDIAVNWN